MVKTELKLENDELAEWLRVQAEKEEDNVAIQKYSKEDESRIKALNSATEKLTVEVNKKRAVLSCEVTETQTAQLELEKTTEEFRALHLERQGLISQWEAAVVQMQKRDADIVDAQQQYAQNVELLNEAQRNVKERAEKLAEQQALNDEAEKATTVEERKVSFIYPNK